MMLPFLASGGRDDLAGPSIALVLKCVLVLGLAACLSAIPAFLARRRGLPWAEAILAGAVLWGLLAALFAGNFLVAEFRRAQEHLILLMRGYDDPAATEGGPRQPWGCWAALGGVYVVLVAVALLGKRRRPAGPGEQGSP
jgi:hypothetical protein